MNRLRRLLLPALAFALVAAVHVAWSAAFPERDPVQDRWAPVASADWLALYRQGQGYFLTYAYGLSGAFVTVALRRWWERRQRAAGGVALGSAAASGLFAAASCWLLGCCGSPMLGVYLALLGPAVVPFAEPAVAGLTTASVVLGLWWLEGREVAAAACSGPCACGPPGAPIALSRPTPVSRRASE